MAAATAEGVGMVGRYAIAVLWRRRAFACAALVFGVVSSVHGGHASQTGVVGASCPTHPDDRYIQGRLADGRGDFLLDDGQPSRLAWLDTPEDFVAARRQGLEALLLTETAQPATVLVRAGGVQDRWGAVGIVADIPHSSGGCIGVQQWLLRQGLARLRAETANEPAPVELAVWRQAEREAEAARRGLWASHVALNAADPAAIERHEGRFVVVEGVVASVNERSSQTYLNFGTRWSEDMTVSAPARIWRILKRSGLTAAGLQGGKIRVRGIVERRGGPLIELGSPADLDVAILDFASPEDAGPEVAGTGSRP